MTDTQNMPAPYVEQVLKEQDAFREAGPAMLPKAVRSISKPLSILTNKLIPAEVIEAAIRGADWAASSSIRKAAINHDFNSLRECDDAVADIRRWALGYAVTGGGAAGAFGAIGLAIDVPATVALALRTVRLTGLSYGFGGDSEAERIHVLDVLQLAGANSIKDRNEAMCKLEEGRASIGREDWQKIVRLTGQSTGSVAAVHKVATTLGINLSTRKVAQLMPFVGAAIGAGVNAAFQNDVAAAARYAYRARWLEINEGIIDRRLSTSELG